MSFNLVWIGVRMSFILVGWICQFGRAFDSTTLFRRQPAVAWQGFCFFQKQHIPGFLDNYVLLLSSILGYVFAISSVSGHEKDAQCDLEKNHPIFVP